MKTILLILALSLFSHLNAESEAFGGMQESFVKLNGNDLNTIINGGEKSVRAQIAAAEALKAEQIRAQKERMRKEAEAKRQAKLEEERKKQQAQIEEDQKRETARKAELEEKRKAEAKRLEEERLEKERIEREKQIELERLERERIKKEELAAQEAKEQAEHEAKEKEEQARIAEAINQARKDSAKRPLMAYLSPNVPQKTDKKDKEVKKSGKQEKYLADLLPPIKEEEPAPQIAAETKSEEMKPVIIDYSRSDWEEQEARAYDKKQEAKSATLQKADMTLPFTARINSDKATLRLCADKSCQIVDRAKEGEELTFIAHEGDRYQTEQGRWIHGDFVEPISNLKYDDLVAKINAPAELRTKTGNTLPFLGVINSSKATIRNCAKQSCKIVDRPKKGNHYLFVEQSGDRLKTSNGEWIHEDFIEIKKHLNFKEAQDLKTEASKINANTEQPNQINEETAKFIETSDENASKVLAKKGIVLDPAIQRLIDEESVKKEKDNEKLQQDTINYAQSGVNAMKTLDDSEDKSAALIGIVGGYAKNFVKNEIESYLREFRNGINLDVGWDYDLTHNKRSGSGKVLVPWNVADDKLTLYTQTGIGQYPNERWIGHVGVGARFFPYAKSDVDTGDTMFGINTVYDHDFSRGHRRFSVGGEVAYDTLMMTGNVYHRLSGWKPSVDFSSEWVEERPADGWDLNVKYALPFYKQLAMNVGYEKWYGDKVSVFGSTNKNDLEENPDVYKIGVEYQPIPLITLSLDHARTSKDDKSTTVKLNFKIPLGDKSAWRKATNPRYAGISNTVEASRNSFIKRNYSMPLEYRAKQGKYHIDYCGQPGNNKYCFLITDGFDEIAQGVHVKITPKHSCVVLDNGGNYVTNGQGKVTATITSSCTPSTTLHVQAGESEADFDVKIQIINMEISASPTELERYETSLITLSGNSATSGMSVKWSVEGKGSLSNKSETIDASGKATVTYTPDASSVDGETVKVIADVEGNKFEVTLTIRVYGLDSSLTVSPAQIGNTEWSTAELSGLRPGTDVTFTLTTNNESATLHATKE